MKIPKYIKVKLNHTYFIEEYLNKTIFNTNSILPENKNGNPCKTWTELFTTYPSYLDTFEEVKSSVNYEIY